MKKACAIGWLLSLAISFASSLALAEARCAHHDPLRQPFYGDTHVHTALSFDAWGQGTLATPDDAYRFAKGEAIGFQPYDADGNPQSQAQLRRPLDYAVVTDHSDLLGETRICSDPAASGHDSLVCRVVRRFPKLGYMLVNGHVHSNENPERYSFCGEAGERCLEAAGGPWREIQEAAAAHLDQSNACGFTTFVGYEWTGMPGGNNIHRNVIFANDIAQARPTTYTETPTQEGLWEALRSECLDAPPAVPGGARCDVLAIPHNSNVSGGRIFTIARADGTPISADDAATRARLERLVEVTQHKGDSECRPGAADELCEYETLGFPRMMDMLGSVGDVPEIPPRVYVREVLGEGLLQTERLGVNPFQYGIVGATDTHFGTPGMVDEDAYRGHAAGSVDARFGVPAYPDRSDFNPGGLGVLWAEENSRASLFAAMKRREVYGTSGPRIQVRFFGGFELSEAICSAPDFAARGYAGGVPMGGTLGPNQAGGDRSLSPGDTAPRFAIQALRDPGGGGVPTTALQRIQVVKGWLEEGVVKERVFDVAGDPVSPASVDLGTCKPRGAGFDQLCSIWTDPDFDPEAHAFYYARVIENPSCRWNAWTCLRAGVSCSDPASVPGELAACCDPSVPQTIQERAWTSPIWYVPGPAG